MVLEHLKTAWLKTLTYALNIFRIMNIFVYQLCWTLGLKLHFFDNTNENDCFKLKSRQIQLMVAVSKNEILEINANKQK